MRLKNKVAIITGATRGIGEAIACRFIEEGARVTLCARGEAGLKQVESKIKEMKGECLVLPGDILNETFVTSMVEKTVKVFGGLDILVNNVGATADSILHKMTVEQWNQVMDINLKGTFICLREAAIYMRQHSKGTIINVSSTAMFGNPGQLNYSTSKGGIVSMTRTAALELARRNVTCNCLAPGTIWTPLVQGIPVEAQERLKAGIPLGRFGDPREVANVAVFLASDDASYITGQTIHCDGGAYMR
jgi:NAD(P)-dependent dehydrogenase (short-subunit alcohol dehydrogenase family)